jgi:ABC-type sugar transport system permease subunit
MNRLVSVDPDQSVTNRRRLVEWALWPVAASLLCFAIFAATRAGCGSTSGRDWAVFGAATFTGLATAVRLWRSLRAWQALAISLALSVAVIGILVFLGLLSWIHQCAN